MRRSCSRTPGIVQQPACTAETDQQAPRSARCPTPARAPGRSSTTTTSTCPLTPEFGQDALPDGAARRGDRRPAGRMRYELRGEMQLAVGVPIPSVDAAYFEIVSLDELESTLAALGVSLVGASLVTTLAGAALGCWASRRALRPLAGVSTAAEAIAGGRLDTRLEASDDPDLRPITASFNDMAQALAGPDRAATPASPPTSATSCAPR